MNIALIFAGGTGQRYTPRGKPKQFLELGGRPIIVHAIEPFQRHADIASICVVCKAEWIEHFKSLKQCHHLSKVAWIVEGGATAQESIYNGLKTIAGHIGDRKDVTVLLNDGVRPLVDEDLISRNIACVRANGSAVTVAPATETVVVVDDDGLLRSSAKRHYCRLAKAPQSFYLHDILDLHERARRDGVDEIDAASLMLRYGKSMHTVPCSADNIKITTPVDYFLYKAIIMAKENESIFGL